MIIDAFIRQVYLGLVCVCVCVLLHAICIQIGEQIFFWGLVLLIHLREVLIVPNKELKN